MGWPRRRLLQSHFPNKWLVTLWGFHVIQSHFLTNLKYVLTQRFSGFQFYLTLVYPTSTESKVQSFWCQHEAQGDRGDVEGQLGAPGDPSRADPIRDQATKVLITNMMDLTGHGTLLMMYIYLSRKGFLWYLWLFVGLYIGVGLGILPGSSTVEMLKHLLFGVSGVQEAPDFNTQECAYSVFRKCIHTISLVTLQMWEATTWSANLTKGFCQQCCWTCCSFFHQLYWMFDGVFHNHFTICMLVCMPWILTLPLSGRWCAPMRSHTCHQSLGHSNPRVDGHMSEPLKIS